MSDHTNEELVKHLSNLIDETLEEIEEIKKSRFAAAEIKIEGPSDTKIGEAPTNGKLESKKAEEAEEESDEEEDEEEEKKKVKKKEKEEDEEESEEDEEEAKKSQKEEESLKKSEFAEVEKLFKSYVDERINAFEGKLSDVISMLNEIADKPAPRKSVAAGAVPLTKSIETEPLNKHALANELFELKKSGKEVDSADIIRVETGGDNDWNFVAKKYGIR